MRGLALKTQDYSAQVDALRAAGCERIFSEKRSGKSATDLARSSRHLQHILHVVQRKGCGFVSLGESWCNTTSEVGKLMLTIISPSLSAA